MSFRVGGAPGIGGHHVDPESLERQNDGSIAALAERVGMLKAATAGVRDEAEGQHALLDRLADGVGQARGMAGVAAQRLGVVLSDREGRRQLGLMVGAATAALLFVWYVVLR
jgi:hypothetical protein